MVEKLSDLKFLKVKVEKHPTRSTMLEFLEKPDAIASLILNESKDKVLLVDQYRPGARKNMLEIPAGIIELGETAKSTLVREIREETGYEEKDYEIIYETENPLILSPGYTSESLYIYIVRLKKNTTPMSLILDEGEDLIPKWIELDKVLESTLDMKTHYAVNLYKLIK